VSKEDQEEAAQAIVNAKNEKELEKNQKTLKDQITTNEKNKADLIDAQREGGSEGLAPTIVKADADDAKESKKKAADLKKIVDKKAKEVEKAAKDTDKEVNKEYKFESAKASLKAFPPAKDALA